MKIAVLFGRDKITGKINIVNGVLKNRSIDNKNETEKSDFQLPSGGRLEITLAEFSIKKGAYPTIINVFTDENPFSFFLRDVNSDTPIYIPEFKIAIVPATDSRDFQQVADAVAGKMLLSDFGRFENEPEESYENACKYNRDKYSPIWLGTSRDMRIFRVGYQEGVRDFKYWGQIRPCYHSVFQSYPADKKATYEINFEIGPGAHCRPHNIRKLECGVLPILRAVQDEADIQYHITSFASLEKEVLTREAVRGSDWLAAYANTNFNMISAEQKEEIKDLLDQEMNECEQEIICALRVEAVNVSKTPNYAFFKAPHFAFLEGPQCPDEHEFKNGMSWFKKWNKVYAVTLIDGDPMPDEEMSILVQPGQKVVYDILIPHSSIIQARAEDLFNWDFEKHLDACRDFWLEKLDSAAKIAVPETAIDERIKAGLLHCDLVTLGLEPDGPALATIGWYGPIGTESSPIIQFFDSMGWHKLAERSIQFFLERQSDSGFIQNYNNYESETGPLLWTAGEHFRYTHDITWLKNVMPKLKKAANYLLEWRNRNKRPELKAIGGYGLIDGKVADPDDFYHSYFLNAGTYIGLSRMVEMTAELDQDYSKALKKEVENYRQDIIVSVYYAQAKAPVVPISDGSWAPLLPPWSEHTGALHLYTDGANCFSHGSFLIKTAAIGANWLIISEVLEPYEQASDFIQKTNQYPMTRENAAYSQPYYSRHDFAHVKRGEVKAFLKTYYNQFTALQDREIYTFWEHYYGASQHKTHEEAWFLMQTRWMLYLEEGDTLSMLKTIPRRWLKDGEQLTLDGVKSHFGQIYFKAESDLKNNKIKAVIKLVKTVKMPAKVTIRLPHPEGLKAISCKNSIYDLPTETVTIDNFTGKASVILEF
jgi:hypothetical protein